MALIEVVYTDEFLQCLEGLDRPIRYDVLT